jgi:hypothetical protein
MNHTNRYPKAEKYSNALSIIYRGRNDPYRKSNPEAVARIIQQDGGRWLTYGYIIG